MVLVLLDEFLKDIRDGLPILIFDVAFQHSIARRGKRNLTFDVNGLR